MINELQGLGLDVRILDAEGGEIDLKRSFDDEEEHSAYVTENLAEVMGATGGVDDSDLEDGYHTTEGQDMPLFNDDGSDIVATDDAEDDFGEEDNYDYSDFSDDE